MKNESGWTSLPSVSGTVEAALRRFAACLGLGSALATCYLDLASVFNQMPLQSCYLWLSLKSLCLKFIAFRFVVQSLYLANEFSKNAENIVIV